MTPEQELRKDEAARWWDYTQKALGYAKDYGAATLQSLILVNGGAVVVTLTAISGLFAKDIATAKALALALSTPIQCFVAGLIFAIAASGLGYINFREIGEGLPSPHQLTKYISDDCTEGWKQRRWAIRGSAWIAVVLVMLSVLAFGAGSTMAVAAFSRISI